jgi:hypothetical protein
MVQPIRHVLNRRTDLSTFVAHLTRDHDGLTARDAPASIMRERIVRAKPPMGWVGEAQGLSDRDKQTQQVVSFSETPLEHIYSA